METNVKLLNYVFCSQRCRVARCIGKPADTRTFNLCWIVEYLTFWYNDVIGKLLGNWLNVHSIYQSDIFGKFFVLKTLVIPTIRCSNILLFFEEVLTIFLTNWVIDFKYILPNTSSICILALWNITRTKWFPVTIFTLISTIGIKAKIIHP